MRPPPQNGRTASPNGPAGEAGTDPRSYQYENIGREREQTSDWVR